MDDARLRTAVVAAGRRLGHHGLISAGEGNLSVRLGDGTLLMTPSGRRKDELTVVDLLVVPEVAPKDEAFAPGKPRPSSDLAIHRAAYLARAGKKVRPPMIRMTFNGSSCITPPIHRSI